MLRVIGHSLTVLTVVSVLLGGGVWAYRAFQEARTGGGQAPAAAARATPVYRLGTDGWTTFPLARGVPAVRLLAHADLADGVATGDRRDPVRFAVAVQGLNADGSVVVERVHHFETGVTLYSDPQAPDRPPRPGKFYGDRDRVASNTELAVVNLPRAGRVDRIRLRAAAMGPDVKGVATRLYAPERLSGRQVAARWPRLSPSQRARLADGNVYPAGLLAASERAELSAVRWQRVGPAGLAGRDYDERTLYIREEGDAETVEEPVTPAGVRVGPHRRATVPLPEGGAELQVQFTALADASLGGQARVHAYGDAPGAVQQLAGAWAGRTVRLERSWQGRLLELQSDVPAIVRLFPKGQTGGGDPTPDPAVVRVYRGDASPSWPVRHVADRPTPFRIDLRCACFDANAVRQAVGDARIEWLDAQGRVIERTAIRLDAPPSLYDQLRADDGDRLVSEPRSLYFRLPARVAEVRVAGGAEVLAAAFNRPDGLRRTLRVPEDRFAQPADALRDRRSWFYLPPSHTPADGAASAALAVQARPPEIDPLIAAGDYDWTAYRPTGDWRARRVLVPRDTGTSEIRPEALAASYVRLHPGRTRTLTIDAATPRPVRPDLVFAGHAAGQRAKIAVSIDGQTVLSREVRASTGRLTLPALTPGRHDVRIESASPARFYLSNVTSGGGARYGLALANRLAPGTTRFVYDKTTDGEVAVAFRFYPVLPSPARRTVDVRIRSAAASDPGPHDGLTLRRRRYDLRVDTDPSHPVLGTQGQRVGVARRFVVTLGADLPPGRYPIEVALNGAGEAYLTLSTATPGRTETRNIRQGETGDAP